jgi:dephospho-CoA kinase
VIIGLTGGIASGKSTVANMVKEQGFPVVDADLIAREVVRKGQPAYHLIIEQFGKSVLEVDGNIDRGYLGSIIFNDEGKRKQLNDIVHPEVRKMMLLRAEEYIQEGAKHVFLDIPLLFESKLTHLVEKVILVYVDLEVQLNRLMSRNELTEKDALSRIQSQMPLKDKIPLADKVINNNKSLDHTQEQLHHILLEWEVLKAI